MDPFCDVSEFLRLPRLAGLVCGPGGRVVVGVNGCETWEAGSGTVCAGTPAGFLGDQLLVERDGALWRESGEPVVQLPGGVDRVVARGGVVVFGSALLPESTVADDQARRAARDTSAVLYDGLPVRYWDRDLGPDWTRLLVLEEGSVRDLTGFVRHALDDECGWDLTPDGRTVVSMWAVAEPGGFRRYTLVAIDIANGARRVLADDPALDFEAPAISPDGTAVALVVRRRATPDDPEERWLRVVTLAGDAVSDLARDWDRWPARPRWTPDGSALVVVADHQGRAPLWRVDVCTGAVDRVTPDDGAYSDVTVTPDGVYAIRAAVDSPPVPVRVGGPPLFNVPRPAGRLVEVTATGADGTPLRAWLALPNDHTPAPLLLWVHGGPVHSFNTWLWRWNPWLFAAKGYAVLLPDPALSTGYGIDFIRRGWGNWAGNPVTDLLALTDAAIARDDVDGTRTAVMGGSFGGYMANWLAGHTDRFAAIISQAGDWVLEQSMMTGDLAHEFRREMTPASAARNSPHRFADAITTPILIIHGAFDYRTPISESHRMWADLVAHGKAAHRFLYFPDESHIVTKPGNVVAWHETVFAFLAEHLAGRNVRGPTVVTDQASG